MRIVIADDSTVERGQAKRILTDAGHVIVAECENGEEAIKAVLEHKPDVVMLDLMMRFMTGDKAALKLREVGYTGGIVFATKNSQPAVMQTLALVNGSLAVKMYRADKLLSAIEEAARKVR